MDVSIGVVDYLLQQRGEMLIDPLDALGFEQVSGLFPHQINAVFVVEGMQAEVKFGGWEI